MLGLVLPAASPTPADAQGAAPRMAGDTARRWLVIRSDDPQSAAAPASTGDSLAAMLGRLHAPVTLLVTHVGIDDAELGALVDMNTDGGLAGMSRHRQGELDALTAPRFREALGAHRVTPITYRQLIEKLGLQSMRTPGGR